VVNLFIGQPNASQGAIRWQDSLSSLKMDLHGIANQRVIDDKTLLNNLQSVQKKHAIPLSSALETLKLEDGTAVGNFPNFTIEMETGTGKTYVYLRTIYELNKTYGFKKFVIVVPSVAIREGVLASLKITHEHLQSLYGHVPVVVTAYRSAQVNTLRNFSIFDAIQILVINIDAFAKDSQHSEKLGKSKGNIINQLREQGTRPIEFIQTTQPIVILDEPQNLETDARKQAIARLNPLCALRYSATHRHSYNLIYSLDPVRAWELGLVKQIGVDSVIELGRANQAFIELQGFSLGKRTIAAKLTIWANQTHGPTKKTVTVKVGDDLYADTLSNRRELYRDEFIVNELDAREGFIRFANNVRVEVGRPHGALTDALLRLQIEATVRRHFEQAKKLHPLGIKVLSVFFIDRVNHYRVYTKNSTPLPGKFAQWFEEIYQKIQAELEFDAVLKFKAAQVHNGYFSQDKQTISPFETRNSKTHQEAENSAFELIMRDKARLLSLEEPLAFIFSHSALREGWDNPNVFQICTLAESSSHIKKRQEIGRGLRLAVNQHGQRIRDKSINQLTIIANESYEDFARQLQTEMQEAGVRFTKEMVGNTHEKIKIRLKDDYDKNPYFLRLWEQIRQRTRYRVNYSTSSLINQASACIHDQMPSISRPQLALSRAELSVDRSGISSKQTRYRTQEVDASYVMPDFIGHIQSKTGLSAHTISQILLKSQRLAEAINNPQLFIEHCISIINAVKRNFLIYGDGTAGSGIQYTPLNNDEEQAVYEMRSFESDHLREAFPIHVQAVEKEEKTLFNHIMIDANSGPERAFAKACENNEDVLFYIKLPRWFAIDTPLGKYTPDWALAWRNNSTLYFVVETKSTGAHSVHLDLLRPLEQLKIECGKRHFKNFQQVQFKVVPTLEALLT